MHKERLSARTAMFQATEALHSFVIAVKFRGLLAGVQKAGFLLFLPGVRDIDIQVWLELLGLFACHDLEVQKGVFLLTAQPCLIGEQGSRAMVPMRIQGPMRETTSGCWDSSNDRNDR